MREFITRVRFNHNSGRITVPNEIMELDKINVGDFVLVKIEVIKRNGS